MRLETNSERAERLLREARSDGTVVPGRTLPKGKQWVGYDLEGRGSAPARRLRQQARQQAKQERSSRPTNSPLSAPAVREGAAEPVVLRREGGV